MKITEDDFGFNVSNCCDGTNLREEVTRMEQNNRRIVVLFWLRWRTRAEQAEWKFLIKGVVMEVNVLVLYLNLCFCS